MNGEQDIHPGVHRRGMGSGLRFTDRFEAVRDPVRAATRAPGVTPAATRVMPFRVGPEASAFLMTITRGRISALRAAVTWVAAAYLRKVARGDAVVLAVPAGSSPGRWSPVRCDVLLDEPAKTSLIRVRDALEELDAGGAPDLDETAAAFGLPVSERDNGLCDTAVMLVGSSADQPFPASIALGLRFELLDGDLHGELHARSDCFDPRDIDAMPGHLEALVRAFASDISRPLAGLSLLSPDEAARLVERPNDTAVHLAGPDTVPAAFALVAARKPDETAVVAGSSRLSYAELAARAHRVAAGLLAAGVARGSRVGLMCERDEWLLPALLGILEAGCAYVPLDPDYPGERIRWILEDCEASALLASTSSTVPAGAPRTLRLEELPDAGPARALHPRVAAGDAAYFIYTSGSTGRPKGVRVDHGNVINFFAGMDAVLPRAEGDVWLAVTSISFDISVLELLWTLCRGMRVVVHESGRLLAPDAQGEPRAAPAFSLFFFADCDDESAAAHYDLLFRAAELADREGMEAVWVPERHFHRFGGLFPNPSLAAAAIAARTRRVGIRAGSVVAPLHNPLRIAEEWSFVDNISRGRIGVSFASGWNPRDFVLAPGAFADRRQTVFRDMEFVRRFWRGEVMTLSDGERDHQVRLYPTPVQPELPVWVTASDSIETFVKAGAARANVLTHLLHHSFEALEAKIAAYRAALREHHGDASGRVTVMVHTFVGDSEREVLDAVREPFLRYLRSSAELMRAALPPGLEAASLKEEDREAIVQGAFARFFEERGLFGTPESCLEKVRRVQDAGADEIACLVDFIPDQELVYRHLRHLAALQSLARARASQLDVAGQIEAHGVSHLQCTPSLAKSLMESGRFRKSLRRLKVFAVGGEPFPGGLRDAVRRCSDAALLNMYGPTETTVWSTAHRVEDASDDVPLGRPIANTQVYVVGPDLAPLPANRPGELCIGGKGVAAGYWNRAELTAEKFVRDPFSSDAQARLYRTGDLVRWDHDGALRFLGRVDRQVKIRGHRVELGEIESRMLEHPGVRDAVVVSRRLGNADHLCAYYRSDDALEARGLAEALAAALPATMVPEFFVRVDAFPLTPNRKIDVRALPDPLESGAGAAAADASDPATGALLDIWRRVLGRANMGPHDDFFRSGGDSIQAIQVAAQANAVGLALSPKLIYEHPTAAALLRALAGASAPASPSRSLPEGPLPLLPAQTWFFAMEIPRRGHWNQSLLLRLRGGVRPDWLRAAAEAAFERHPAFRLRFRLDPAGWSQAYGAPSGAAVAYHLELWDPVDPSSADPARAIVRQADAAHRALDIADGPLAAAVHCCGFPAGDALILTAHHLVVDGVSWRILLEDVERAYRMISEGGAAALPAAPGPHLLVDPGRERADEIRAAEAFWTSRLSDLPPPIWGADRSFREEECDTFLSEATGPGPEELGALCARLKTDAEAIALAAFVRAVRLAGLSNGLVVDMETHGRSLVEDEASAGAVGWLTRIYPLVLPPGGDGAEETLCQVKSALREVAPHERLFPGHGAQTDASGRPQIIFNYLGSIDASLGGSSLFSSVQLSPGTPRDPGAVRHHALEVNVHQSASGLVWEFVHPTELVAPAAIRELAELCSKSLADLGALSPDAAASCLLAEDFPGASLERTEVRDLAARPGGLVDAFPATAQQRAMFFQLHACPADRSRFVHQALLSVEGCDDQARLESALREVAAHHGAFRSAFLISRAGSLVQTVAREAAMPVRRLDWSSFSPEERDARLAVLRKLDLEEGVDPIRAPLARVMLLRTAPRAYLLLWTFHHLIADGWSLPLVIRDLEESYATGRAPSTPAGDFGRFARWLERVDRGGQEAFWTRTLEGMKPPAPLSPRGRKSDFSYRVEYGVLDETAGEDAMARWEHVARGEGATFAALLQAAWGVALCRASCAVESSFGVTVAGRPAEVPGVENTVGLFIHSVPFRFRIAPGDTPASLLRRVHREGSALRENAYVEPAFIGRAMGLKAGQIAFETLVVLANFARAGDSSAAGDGLRLQALDLLERNSVPLTVMAIPGRRLALQYVFDLRQFDRAEVEALHGMLVAALDDLARDPAAPVRIDDRAVALAAGDGR